MLRLVAVLMLAITPATLAEKKACHKLCRDVIATCITTQCIDITGHAGGACARIAKSACKAISLLRCKANTDPTGCLAKVTTFKGQPISLRSGDILVTAPPAIVRVDPVSGAQTIVASSADHRSFAYGEGIAVAPNGDVLVLGERFGFFLNRSNPDVVIRIHPSTGQQATLPTPALNYLVQDFFDALDLAVADSNDILVANQFGVLVRVDPATGAQNVLLGPGLVYPRGIAVAGNGDIFVANAPFTPFAGVAKVHVINGDYSSGVGILTVISSDLVAPFGIAVSGSDVIVSDNEQAAILRVNSMTGTTVTVSQGGLLSDPLGIAIAANGDIIVADAGPAGSPGSIVRVDPLSGAQTTLSSGGNLQTPVGVAIVP